MQKKKKIPKSLYQHFHSGKWAKRAKEREQLSLRLANLIEWAKTVGAKTGVDLKV